MGLPPKSSVESRLVKHLKVDEDGCWIYTGSNKRRPLMSVREDGVTKLYYVPRIAAWLWKSFDLDSPLRVLHYCDKPACCNPDCLWEGTQSDNVRDAVAKGRWTQGSSPAARAAAVKGEKHHKAKLTERDIRSIRMKVGRGVSQSAVAREYGVKSFHVGRIVRGESWKHVK